jgi:hypothetical protein
MPKPGDTISIPLSEREAVAGIVEAQVRRHAASWSKSYQAKAQMECEAQNEKVKALVVPLSPAIMPQIRNIVPSACFGFSCYSVPFAFENFGVHMRGAGQTILDVLTVASSCVTIYVAFATWYPTAAGGQKQPILFLSLLSFALLLALLASQLSLSRRAKFADIPAFVNDSSAHLHTLLAKTTPPGKPEIRGACQFTVEKLSEAFSNLTGKQCSVCVKLVVDPGNTRYYAQTLCRTTNLLNEKLSPGNIRIGLIKIQILKNFFVKTSGISFPTPCRG